MNVALPDTPLLLFRIIVGVLILAFFVYLSSTIICRKRFSMACYGWSILSHFCVICFNCFVIGRDSPYILIIAFLSTFFVVWLSVRAVNLALIRDGFVLCGLYILGDAVCGLIMTSLFSVDAVVEMRYFMSPATYLPNLIVGTVLTIFSLLYAGARSIVQKHKVSFYLLRVIRPAFLLAVIILLYIRNMQRVSSLPIEIRNNEVTTEMALIVPILLLGATYIVQDIRYAQQMKRNQTLEQQQEMQNILLQDTRMFRHNIANMLYGLQGMILTRDYDSIERYYQKITEKCAVINNENVVALRRIPSLALNALLVQKLQAANSQSLPFYVFTDEGLNWHNAKDETICEILGVLMDNAIEAAQEAQARYISLEAHNVPHGVELVVRNTWKQDTRDFLYHADYASTKPGHEGLGLRSVRRAVAKDRHMIFNLYPAGRYIEANLQVFW